MNDADIIKALECFAIDKDFDERQCVGCAFETKGLCCENCSEGIAKASLDLIKRQDAELERLQYILLGVMHSVDKWLDGEELKQDEVNRAATMREKTLQITEKQQAEIERFKRELNSDVYELQVGRSNGKTQKVQKVLLLRTKAIKAEAIKEFAERLKYRTCCIPQHHFTYAEVEQHIDYLVKEMAGDTE